MATLDRMPKKLSNSRLPEEIIEEKILMALPVKTLCRFKTVSKTWYLLISGHNFANAYLNKSTDNHDRLLFGSDSDSSLLDMYSCSLEYTVQDDSVVTIYPPPKENLMLETATLRLDRSHEQISIVGSCNGLVCLSITVTDLVLWNPATRQLRYLPNSGTNYLNLDNWDDDCFDVQYAFGHDAEQDDYNVVECSQYITGQTIVKMYSVRSNSWRTVDWRGPRGYLLSNGVFWNGEICWLIEKEKQNVVDVVFHRLSTDTCTVLPSPSGMDNFFCKYALTVICGSLAICMVSGISHLEIWFLKEKAWTKAAHLPFPLGLNDAHFRCPSPLFLSLGKVLINYGSNISVCESSQPGSHRLGSKSCVVATTYMESLISPYIN